MIPETGLSLWRCGSSQALTPADLDWALHQVSMAYRVDAYDEDSADFALVKMIYDDAQEEGMSAEEFRGRLKALRKSTPFATWTPADFFKADTVRVYPHAWYQARIAESRSNRTAIGCYDVGGNPAWGWKHEIGDKLPKFTKPLTEKSEPSEHESPDDMTAQNLKLVKECAAKSEEIHDLKQAVKSLRRERDLYRKRVDVLEAAVEWLETADAKEGVVVEQEEA